MARHEAQHQRGHLRRAGERRGRRARSTGFPVATGGAYTAASIAFDGENYLVSYGGLAGVYGVLVAPSTVVQSAAPVPFHAGQRIRCPRLGGVGLQRHRVPGRGQRQLLRRLLHLPGRLDPDHRHLRRDGGLPPGAGRRLPHHRRPDWRRLGTASTGWWASQEPSSSSATPSMRPASRATGPCSTTPRSRSPAASSPSRWRTATATTPSPTCRTQSPWWRRTAPSRGPSP